MRLNPLVLIFFSATLCPAVSRSQTPPPLSVQPGAIVAIVGDEVVTRSDLEREFRRLVPILEQRYRSTISAAEKARFLRVILKDMIDNSLLLQKAKQVIEKDGRIQLTDFHIDREIEKRLESLRDKGVNVADVSDLYRLERERNGWTREQLRNNVKDELLRRIYLADFVFSEIDPWVSPKEMEYYYQTHQEEFSSPVAVEFRQILIDGDRPTVAYLRKQVEEGLQSGVSFRELAEKYSADKGRLWKKDFEELESWPAPIPEVLKRLQVGQVSPPQPSDRGLHYLFLEKRINSEPLPYEEAQETIVSRVRVRRHTQVLDQLLDELRGETNVENLLGEPEAWDPGQDDASTNEQETPGDGDSSDAPPEPRPSGEDDHNGKENPDSPPKPPPAATPSP